MPVSFVDEAKDKEEEKRIKSLAPPPSEPADGDDEDDEGGIGMVEKSIMPGKRSTPVGQYSVTVMTLQLKEMGPFSVASVATVGDIKALVAKETGMPAEMQRLFFEIPRHAGSVVGGGESNLAPGVPATVRCTYSSTTRPPCQTCGVSNTFATCTRSRRL